MSLTSRDRFARALAAETVDRPPVWMMRQAGRTLPEYRALREKHTFWEVCRTPELAAEVTCQPMDRFPLDAAVIFSDILTVPDIMGLEVKIDDGLSLSPVVRDREGVETLRVPDTRKELAYVGEAIRLVRERLGPDRAILGFAGAPYTISSYMVEGGSSRHYAAVKSLILRDPTLARALLDRVAAVVTDLLKLQLDAGADAVQLFDSWAGELSVQDFNSLCLPVLRRIVEDLDGAPVIYYVNGIGNLLEAAAATGATVLGIDWRVDLQTVRERLGEATVVQGNLDPATLMADTETIQTRTRKMLEETGGRGHIANLGHGLLPDTPLTGIEAFVAAVTEWRHS
jgi:uroporphyrinogen decarboxylase